MELKKWAIRYGEMKSSLPLAVSQTHRGPMFLSLSIPFGLDEHSTSPPFHTHTLNHTQWIRLFLLPLLLSNLSSICCCSHREIMHGVFSISLACYLARDVLALGHRLSSVHSQGFRCELLDDSNSWFRTELGLLRNRMAQNLRLNPTICGCSLSSKGHMSA